jgi:DGQHR domain-containing protein
MSNNKIDRISVVVPVNPFTPQELKNVHHCLCALDVEKLMEWWPGLPHKPHQNPKKVKAIQRSLDWKRVAQIGAYLLQEEIEDCGDLLDEIFGPIYHPKKNDPGREWPPQIRGTVKYARSSFPFFTNVLVHVNGATFHPNKTPGGTAEIGLNPSAKAFQLTVIDGQHRVNGAYFALVLRRKNDPNAKFEIPAEIFLDLDQAGAEPKHQAQIFIDVNLYQKKVDRSLVADLFPTTRGDGPLDRKDRAQDIGRKLMLEVGPLVGMIQIPGIKYGVKDVVTLATLNAAIEGAIPALDRCDITNLESQTSFLAQMLDCWLKASGRAEAQGAGEVDPQNVVYQGRILVSVIDLVPAVLAHLKQEQMPFVSEGARIEVTKWLRGAIERAGLLPQGKFVVKDEFKKLGFLGSGGIGRFRNLLWVAATRKQKLGDIAPEKIIELSSKARIEANKALG